MCAIPTRSHIHCKNKRNITDIIIDIAKAGKTPESICEIQKLRENEQNYNMREIIPCQKIRAWVKRALCKFDDLKYIIYHNNLKYNVFE